MRTNRLLPLLGAMALAVPGAALADSGSGQGQGHGKANAPGQLKKGTTPSSHTPPAHGRGRNLILKGAVTAVDTTANTVTVSVTGGNHAAKAFKGQTVVFDVSKARIRAADSNGNGTRNELADVAANDKVLVHVHLAKGTTATPPLAAKQLVDKTRTH
jgi:VCBS repeat-containing protein